MPLPIRRLRVVVVQGVSSRDGSHWDPLGAIGTNNSVRLYESCMSRSRWEPLRVVGSVLVKFLIHSPENEHRERNVHGEGELVVPDVKVRE